MRRLRPVLQNRKLHIVLLGALLGAVAFFAIYGVAPLRVTDDSWLRGGYVERDITQHYTGWLFYRQSPWQWPLGIAQNMNWPDGGYVGLTDSIPLFAVLFKLLSPLLPATFQYFGLWAFLCSMLQGAGAGLLLSLFTSSRLRAGLLSLLFIAAPIFLDRQLRHCALGAQWLILFALYLYLICRRQGRVLHAGFPALAALAMVIHPYFVPMVLALQFALALEHCLLLHRPVFGRRFGVALLSLGISIATALLAGYCFGAFHQGVGGGSTAYGFFSMNLNALFNPVSRGYTWSLLLPEQNQVLGNYDGFNYLGLGVLLAGVVMAVDVLLHARCWRLLRHCKERVGLLVVCACLAAFAVSNVVTAQGQILFEIPLPAFLTSLGSILRSSGRMFYPVWYLVVLCVCVYILRRPAPAWLTGKGDKVPAIAHTVAVCLLVAAQLADISPALLKKHAEFHPYTAQFVSNTQSDFWDWAAIRYARVVTLDVSGVERPIDIALWAVDHGLITDDSFAARHDAARREERVEKQLQALQNKAYDEDTLYLTSDENLFLDFAEQLMPVMCCKRVDAYWFVFAPLHAEEDAPMFTSTVDIKEYPLMIAQYDDQFWDKGVLTTDRRMVCFWDTQFARSRLEGATGLRTPDGTVYPVLEVSDRDPGWLLVTLDLANADVLRGQPLVAVY